MSASDLRDDQFTFRRNDNIGAAAAEDDATFLDDCFVDIGDLTTIIDCSASQRIVVGRTGAGKSALLRALQVRREHVTSLSPHALSLNFIANSNVIRFFEEAGVNLTPFYMLLWKHVFVVELLRARYNIRTEDNQRSTMSKLRDILYKKDHIKERAVEYLETWGNRFWITTEERLHELTERVESKLTAALGGSALGLRASAGAGSSLSREERSEILERGKRAVSEIQIRELENIIQVLHEEVFCDVQSHYYLTIDTLDEEWAEDRIKYRLIKALIDTVRSFRRVENVKLVVALRQDLLDKVIHSTTDRGFQEEKYESLYLYVRWNKKDLMSLLDMRINTLVRRRYTKQPIKFKDVLPDQIDGGPAADYILDRTFSRPRDCILFLNECIELADGRPRLTATIVKRAEETYSKKRLQSLASEWQLIYPNLKAVAGLFHGLTASIPLSEITKEFLDDRYRTISLDIDRNLSDANVELLDSLYSPDGNFLSIRNTLLRNLHSVGVIGIKTGPTASVSWISESKTSLAPGEVRPNSAIHIHPMFYRALGIRLA